MNQERIRVEVWLYGSLARYAPDGGKAGYAQVPMDVPVGTRMSDLLALFGLPLEEKGITFINGQLTDMPGLGADIDLELSQGDRIGIFHRQSMWPFQYRFGASMSSGLKEASSSRQEGVFFHSPVISSSEPTSRAEGGDLEPTSDDRATPSDHGDPPDRDS